MSEFHGPQERRVHYGLTVPESELLALPAGSSVAEYSWACGDQGRLVVRNDRAWMEFDAEFVQWHEGNAYFRLVPDARGQYSGLTFLGIKSSVYQRPGAIGECEAWFRGLMLPKSQSVMACLTQDGGGEVLIFSSHCGLPDCSFLDEVLQERLPARVAGKVLA